jgi:hypothetical protein
LRDGLGHHPAIGTGYHQSLWLLTFPRQLAVKRRLVGKHRAAKIGDTFQEITHVRILFLAGRRTGRECLSSSGFAEAICSQVRKEQQKGCSATSRCEITINNT